jgi:hypothetical protein
VSASRRTPPGSPAGAPPTRRRAIRRVTLVVAATVAAALVGIPSALGSAWLPWSPAPKAVGLAAEVQPLADVPADEPAKGLVHRGLKVAKKGSRCVGQYEVVGSDECSHGPDAAPPGLNVKSDPKPIAAVKAEPTLPAIVAEAPTDADVAKAEGGALAADASVAVVPEAAAAAAAAPSVGPNGVVCDGDGQAGKRVQVLYMYPAGTASRFSQFLASFRTWAAGVDKIYDASAQETGGSRHLRYVTTADCQVDVREVEIPAASMGDFGSSNAALKTLGYSRSDRKYMIFAESKVYCGIGTFTGDDKPGTDNRNNSGASYARADSGCWSASVAAHEVGHNLGAVANSAPNSSKAGHCVDDYDIMCYKDAPATVLKVVCTNKAEDNILDCNHDDYYSTNPKAGSYLATHWNVANNQFLIAGDGTGSGTPPTSAPPTAPPSPTAKPTPSSSGPTAPPTVGPSTPVPPTSAAPSPTAPVPPTTGPGGTLAKLAVSALTPTSVRLNWAANGANAFKLAVDGRTLGDVRSTAVRLVGLKPAKTYKVQVLLGSSAPYSEVASVQTPAASTPTAGAWFSLDNALTGTSADLYGARSADRTPLVLFRSTGSANQQWQLQAAGAGFRLKSKASGKCVTPLGRATAGAPLTQVACSSAAVWQVTSTEAGLTLSTGGLVAGVGANSFGGQRMLVLQKSTGERHQAWTAATA